MANCPDCGREIEEGKPCPHCSKAMEIDPVASTPTSQKPLGEYTKRFMKDPVGTVQEAWTNHRIRFAWLAMIWMYVVIALTTAIEQLISMVRYSQPFFPTILTIVARAVTDPLSTIVAFLVGAYAVVWMANKEKSDVPVVYKDVLAGFGVAALPYVAALTVAIPFYAGGYAFSGILSDILWVVPATVISPLWMGITLLVVVAYREIRGKTGSRSLVFGTVALLVVQALASWFVDLVFSGMIDLLP
jgi:hypothetical protein